MRTQMNALLLTALLGAGCATGPEPDCSDPALFERGLAGDPLPNACAGPDPAEAWNLGAMIRDRQVERDALQSRLSDDLTREERVRIRQRLIGIERDLPELEALARLEGWLPQAELPNGPPR